MYLQRRSSSSNMLEGNATTSRNQLFSFVLQTFRLFFSELLKPEELYKLGHVCRGSRLMAMDNLCWRPHLNTTALKGYHGNIEGIYKDTPHLIRNNFINNPEHRLEQHHYIGASGKPYIQSLVIAESKKATAIIALLSLLEIQANDPELTQARQAELAL
jgi:hypothetical protein